MPTPQSTYRTRLLAIAILVLAFTAIGVAPAIKSWRHVQPNSREGRWQEDLDSFATEFPARQKDFYKLIPKEKFEREMADIKKSVLQISDAEIILRLMRLAASLGIAHTKVALPMTGPLAFHRYPLILHWFSDGLGVGAVAPQYQDALGARVVRIGTMTPEQLEAGLAPYISFENKSWLRHESPDDMMMTELLQELKVADTKGIVELTLVKMDGNPFTLKVSPTNWSASYKRLITAGDALHIPTPLYHKYLGLFYWYEYLPDTQTLYVQYTVCQNDPKNPFENFAKGLLAFADSHAIRRTVVDLRLNEGGNSEVINPLLDGLRSRPLLNAKGHFFVLIGPSTFSSGEMAAEEFHNNYANGIFSHGPRFNATLVGEPTGGKPNGYGDVAVFKLPNSKLQVQYSTKYFRLSKDYDPESRDPDITVTRSWEDFLAGRDPVLDAALHRPID